MSKVSIILPSYNHKKFLKQRLDSIVNQSFTDWELIIIDDCSTDGSIEVLTDFVKLYKDKVKHFILNESNSGSGYTSWKKGIELANTEYVWIAETDDYSEVIFLEETIKILEQNKECALVFCNSNYVDEQNIFLYDSSSRTKHLKVEKGEFGFFKDEFLLKDLPFKTLITNGSSAVFRNPSKKLPSEIFSYKQMSDLFLWSYLVSGHMFAFLSKNLNFFRRHEESTTTKFSKSNTSNLYFERASYINFFKVPERHNQFIKHYIKYFVNSNKKSIFSIAPINQIENVSGLRRKYIRHLFDFYIQKIRLRFSQ